MKRVNINYSQCWEDPVILLEALKINTDDIVFSITSGGENVISLMSKHPKKIATIDLSKFQNMLLELKIAGIKALTNKEYKSFIGIEKSKNRFRWFQKCKPHLSSYTYKWWLSNKKLIEEGIIHIGKFEKFVNIFSKYVLPLIHSQKRIERFTKIKKLKEQQIFYREQWDTFRWKLYFRLVTHPFILNRFGRQTEMTSITTTQKVARKYLERLEKSLNSILLSKNYFLIYCLTGSYGGILPYYLRNDVFEKIRKFKGDLEIKECDALKYLELTRSNSFSKFNLSDIFETYSDKDYQKILTEIVRTAKQGALICFWENTVIRKIPESLKTNLIKDKSASKLLSKKDRVFFYQGFNVYKVSK